MDICPNCNIGLDREWDICPNCSQALSPAAIKQAGGPRSRDDRFAANVAWYFHTIPFITALIAAVFADSAVQNSSALVRLLFPPICLILGGFAGLLILKGIAEITEKKN